MEVNDKWAVPISYHIIRHIGVPDGTKGGRNSPQMSRANPSLVLTVKFVAGFLLYSVKEIDLLKEAYPETEFKENAAWQESFFLVRQGLVSTHGYKYGCIVFDLRRRDKSNVPPVQAIVSSTLASFKAASGHSTSWIALGFCRYRLNRVARLD
uniref:Uncharacterized protein n=1 Tax=Oryza sativa subsp. japonica TaxID=39947 RepID=Q6K500_ORYSJ|nr:hypothetical protein [Oryza sativa Japonica Group]BAD19804.1 hypothetical protein [Oryza sativa Japonica Group]